MRFQRWGWGLVVGFMVLSFAVEAHAAGKAKPPSEEPTKPVYSTPNPARKALLLPVGTTPFQLPNGARADFNSDLPPMLATATVQNSNLRPADPGSTEACDVRLELRAAVTTFQLNVTEFGVTFGYNPSGSLGTVSNITGKANVKVGTIAMDFGLYVCDRKGCSMVAASKADQRTAQVKLSVEVDFGEITGGANLLHNSELGEVIRKIMDDGIRKLAQSSGMSTLPWSAEVREYDSQVGAIWFDAGTQSKLAPGQTFVVYAVTDSTGTCNVFKPVAYVHTARVEAVSSYALIDELLDARGIHVGDLVMVRAAPVSIQPH